MIPNYVYGFIIMVIAFLLVEIIVSVIVKYGVSD